jgi:predicted ATP-dependent endonuclease of OLD family
LSKAIQLIDDHNVQLARGITVPITKIEKIHIHKFRLYEDVEIKLGDKITVIAGHNATGKSTLLSLLGHCAELKGADKKPLIHRSFGTDFSEIIKASEAFDKRISSAYTLYFRNNDEVESLTLRTGWQKYNDSKRFRIIPKETPERRTVRKIAWPTLYLGLSRLYPVGESDQPKKLNVRLTSEQKAEFFQAHRRILSLYEEPNDCVPITLREKKTVGIETNTYDFICNSAGQDNLSQIIMAVLSFKALKEQSGNAWKGGLFLIDELDAALHPAAQENLFKYLYQAAETLEIQIAFTTHSLRICEILT